MVEHTQRQEKIYGNLAEVVKALMDYELNRPDDASTKEVIKVVGDLSLEKQKTANRIRSDAVNMLREHVEKQPYRRDFLAARYTDTLRRKITDKVKRMEEAERLADERMQRETENAKQVANQMLEEAAKLEEEALKYTYEAVVPLLHDLLQFLSAGTTRQVMKELTGALGKRADGE